jgi:predicted enzyme related to lactoylglutathione lyase
MDLTRVIIFTHDVTRLAEFYRSNFGLEDVGESGPEWTELSSGRSNIAFHKYGEESEGHEGWIKIVFGSKDVAAERVRLIERGIDMSEVVEFGDIHLCDGSDPDGNRFQISSRGV